MHLNDQKPLIAAAKGLETDRYPVWLLRQAGRYLPEYQKVRSKMSFLELCRDPQKASEVTLQPLKRFDLDAAIIFSDILVPPAHMGQKLTFDKGHGPLLTPTIRNEKDLINLTIPSMNEMAYVGEAISLTRSQLSKTQTMIGFAGAPFTVASYMIEGSGSKNYSETKKLMYTQAHTFNQLLKILNEVTLAYLTMQVQAGAEVIMLFDSWAGHLSPEDYQTYVVPHVEALFNDLQSLNVPLIYYPGQGMTNLGHLNEVKASVLAIDWRVPLSLAQKSTSQNKHIKCFQGNLDPMLLSWGEESLVREKARRILEEANHLKVNHIFNVGHGLLPSTNIDLISKLIEEIRSKKI